MTSDTATTTIKDIPIVGVDDGLRSRKFMLACFFAVVSSAGLFFDKLGGGEFVAVVTLVLGIYSAGNVGHHYVQKKETK